MSDKIEKLPSTAVSIDESVISDGIREISIDILEAEYDQLFEEGFLKDIPLFGTVLNVFKVTQNVVEFANRKKILKFLFELKDIPINRRKAFISKLQKDNNIKDAGQRILIVLCRLDEINKATIIGKLYRSAIEENISMPDFFRLVYSVEEIFFDDLIELYNHDLTNPISDEQVLLSLYKADLCDQTIDDGIKGVGTRITSPKFKYKINRFGEQLKRYGF